MAIMLYRDLLGLPETDIYLDKDINLSAEKQQMLENAIHRMQAHEPIQYILGRADFYEYSFRVAPGTLIPRPETEELVQLIAHQTTTPARILDIGTGSGCIAITLSKLLPQADVHAWDVSPQALALARENNRLLAANVTLTLHNVFDPAPPQPAYNVIVSNPPYITESEKADMDRNVLDWEPETALFVPNHDPLLFYRRIAHLGRSMLAPGGRLYFEINRAYGQETLEMLNSMNYKQTRIVKDLSGNDRIITAHL